ncbi:hypothetical protein V3481_012236 [Fusarium oxysporum f. sp. vasinfectum]
MEANFIFWTLRAKHCIKKLPDLCFIRYLLINQRALELQLIPQALHTLALRDVIERTIDARGRDERSADAKNTLDQVGKPQSRAPNHRAAPVVSAEDDFFIFDDKICQVSDVLGDAPQGVRAWLTRGADKGSDTASRRPNQEIHAEG